MKNQHTLFDTIRNFVAGFDFTEIAVARKAVLQPLIDYLKTQSIAGKEINLNMICTHNSRRSHLAQVWAQTAAAYYRLQKVNCYSGGTQTTALYPMIAQTLAHNGFAVKKIAEGENPVYAIKYGANMPAVIGFSKVYDDDFNPKGAFAAVMTCTEADSGCPYVAGAEQRFAVPFEDPKKYDGTAQQSEKYAERSRQIATEMFYVFSQIKNHGEGQ